MASVALLRSLWLVAIVGAGALAGVLSRNWLVGFIVAFLGAAAVSARFPFRSLGSGGRFEWMTSWEAARLHPWKTRIFFSASFAAIAVFCAAVAGETEPLRIAVLAVATGLLAALLPDLRTAARRHEPSPRRFVRTMTMISVLFLLGAIIVVITGSAALAGCLVGLGAASYAAAWRA